MGMYFVYVSAKGSAHDSMIQSLSQLLSMVPDNKFVIADAGYTLGPKMLTPIRGVRYHLKEWGVEAGCPRS